MAVFITTGTSNIHTTISLYTATQPFTIMCWGYLIGATPTTNRAFISLDPYVSLSAINATTNMNYASSTTNHIGKALSPNTWNHVAMTIKPTSTTNRRFVGYVNGVLDISVADTTTFGTYNGMTIGNWSAGSSKYNRPLNGNIRDVRIWNRVLNAVEINQEMLSAIPIHPQGLLSWVPLDTNAYLDKTGYNRIWTPTTAVVKLGPLKPFSGRGVNFLK